MVLTSAGAHGFERAPTCRALVFSTAAATLGSWLAESRALRIKSTALLFLKRHLGLASINQAVAAYVLLYSARALERRWGVGKFAAFVLYAAVCVAAAQSAIPRTALQDEPRLTGPGPVIVSLVPALVASNAMLGSTVLGMPSPWWAVSATLQVCSSAIASHSASPV